MNKDFMLLNDNTIEITNEYGQEINRGEFKNNNVKDILLSENKVELAEEIQKAFNDELNQNEKVLTMTSYMLKFQGVLIIGLPLFGFVYGALSNPSSMWVYYGIQESITAIAGSIIPIAISTIYWCAIRPKYKKNKRKMEIILSKTEEIKKESEEELTKEKEKVVTYSPLEPLVKVSLEEETYGIAVQMTKDLITHTEEMIQNKVKTRIRKK